MSKLIESSTSYTKTSAINEQIDDLKTELILAESYDQDKSDLIEELESGIREIFAKRGEDKLIEEICNRLIERRNLMGSHYKGMRAVFLSATVAFNSADAVVFNFRSKLIELREKYAKENSEPYYRKFEKKRRPK